ncbi:MAG TPA: hypothetical protein VN131_01690 [Mobilitalea sp.]|nr:hypothetical protein [Mobilitalea sp.]
MMIVYNRFLKYTLLFFVGGFAYGAVEILFRGYSHVSMFIAGGICFILIGLLDEVKAWRNMSFISQMFCSSIIITVIEFITGLIVNVWLKLNVWDYSNLPYNIMGQICLLYSNIWFLISPLAILLDDYLRYYLLREEKPRYRIF